MNFFTFSAPRGGGGRVWKGLGRFWDGLGGFARFGKVRAGLVGLEGWGEGLGPFKRIWEGLGRFGSVWEARESLGRFGRVWKALGMPKL